MIRYRTILFDADNTLLDFTRSEHEALSDTLSFVGVTPTAELIAAYSTINDRMWKMLERGEISKVALRVERFRLFCEKMNIRTDVAKMAEAYTDFLATKSYLIEGALAVSKALAAHCNLYIITNGTKFVQEKRFAASPLMPYYKKSFISEEIGFEKPSVAYFKAVEKEIPDFKKEDTLVVGDSLTSDIKGGILAGLPTCWYNPNGKEKPADLPITYEIKRLEELIPLVLAD